MYQIRSRLVNFRVSEQELEELKAAAALHGARCLSDFARTTILATAVRECPPAPTNGALDDLLAGFDRRLSALEAALRRLNGTFDHALVPPQPGDYLKPDD